MVKKFNEKLLFAAWACHNKYYGPYQMFGIPLKKIFKNMSTFDPQEMILRYDKHRMNELFFEKVAKEKPDLLFLLIIYDEFYIDTLIKIREISPKTKIINFTGDDDISFYSQNILFFPFIDYFFITQPDYLHLYKKNHKKAFLILGADPEKFRPLKIEKKYDVTFVGTAKSDRYDYVKYLVKNGVNVKVFGGGWEKYSDLEDICGGKIDDDAFVTVINQSRINIVFSKTYLGNTHVLDRLPQLFMCNAFSLVEYSEGYHELFEEGKNIVMFKNKEDLLNKARYYLKNDLERNKVALNSYKRCLCNHNILKLLENAFDYIVSDSNKIHVPVSLDMDKKLIILDELDMNLDNKGLINKVEGYDYVSFKKKDTKFLLYKDYMQICSLEKTNKSVSCCDYYLYSNFVGNYAILSAKVAFNSIPLEDISNILDISQFMFKRGYFINNLNNIKSLFFGKLNKLFKSKDIIFVAFPLVQVTKRKMFYYDKEMFLYMPIFEIPFLNMINERNFVNFLDSCKVLIYGLIYERKILSYLFKKMMHNLQRFKSILFIKNYDK